MKLYLLELLICFSLLINSMSLSFSKQKMVDCDYLDRNHKDYQVVEKVYTKMIQVMLIQSAPSLRMAVGKCRSTGYDPKLNTIEIDQQTFKICVDLDSNLSTLAFILGHELGHFTCERKIKRILIGQSYNRIQESAAEEIFSDKYGAMVAFISGYECQFDFNQLFSRIYDEYSEVLKSNHYYPDSKERDKTKRKAQERYEELKRLYEISRFLAIFGQYESASIIMEEIRTLFSDSPMILNNLGVNFLLPVLYQKKSNGLENEKYPIGISELPYPEPKNKKEFNISENMSNALRAFSEAIKNKPDYLRAYLNRACAYVISGEFSAAKIDLLEVERNITLKKGSDFDQEERDLINIWNILNVKENPTFESNHNIKVPLQPQQLKKCEFFDPNKWSANVSIMDELPHDSLFHVIPLSSGNYVRIFSEGNKTWCKLFFNQNRIYLCLENFGEDEKFPSFSTENPNLIKLKLTSDYYGRISSIFINHDAGVVLIGNSVNGQDFLDKRCTIFIQK